MSAIGNKDVFARNLKHYLDVSGVSRRQLSTTLGIPYSTVSEWLNGRKYPRIDRIESVAEYFGILKSDLIEERAQTEKKPDAEIPDELKDTDFSKLNAQNKDLIKTMIATLLRQQSGG